MNGHIHTNSIENFWSLLRRSLGGTYVSVEPIHLQAYIHSFWVKHADDATAWVAAGQMEAGDQVLTQTGKWERITEDVPLNQTETVYNFEVQDDHDYYVGTDGLLVHNSICNYLALGKTEGLSAFANSIGADTYQSLSLDNSLSAVTDILSGDADVAVQLEQSSMEPYYMVRGGKYSSKPI